MYFTITVSNCRIITKSGSRDEYEVAGFFVFYRIRKWEYFMLGQVRVDDCSTRLELPVGATKGRKATVKIRRNPLRRILPLIPIYFIFYMFELTLQMHIDVQELYLKMTQLPTRRRLTGTCVWRSFSGNTARSQNLLLCKIFRLYRIRVQIHSFEIGMFLYDDQKLTYIDFYNLFIYCY